MKQLEELTSTLLSLGGRPSGDPLHMTEQADRLRRSVGRLQTALVLLKGQAPIPYFEGPQADVYAGHIEDRARTMRQIIDEMTAVADSVSQQASRLAHQQVEWDRHFNRVVTGVPSDILHAAERKVGWHR